MKQNRLFHWFRLCAVAEGISFLVLLLVAMPLKYMAGLPQAVLVVGSIHGALFVLFAALAMATKEKYSRPFKWLLMAGISSILPFGTFVMDRRWKQEEAELNVVKKA